MHSRKEWRCSQCGKLLGMFKGDRLHIKFSRCQEYFVGFPAVGICRSCGTLNEQPIGLDLQPLKATIQR